MSRSSAVAFLFFALLGATLANAVSSCVWVFQEGVREGEVFKGLLSPQWPSDTCSASFMSYATVSPSPAGFAMDSLRSPSFSYTPAYGSSGSLVRVNMKITCRIFTNVCDSAAVFFKVLPGLPTTTKASPTTLPSTTPKPTVSTSTSGAPTTVSSPTGMPSTVTGGISQVTGATMNMSKTSLPFTETSPNVTAPTIEFPTTTNATTMTATTTLEPTLAPMGGQCPIPASAAATATVGVPVTIDLGFLNANPRENSLGIKTCLQQLSVTLLPNTASISANTVPPNVDLFRLWSSGGVGGNTMLNFDSKGINSVEGIYTIGYVVNCGRGPLCNATQTVIVTNNLTAPPIATVPQCNQVYGFTSYYGVEQTFFASNIDGETQCPSTTPLRTVVALTVPKISSANFSFNSTTSSFFYVSPVTPTVDTFVLGVQCNGELFCQATAYIVTESATPYTPAPTIVAPTSPLPTLSACPNVYQFEVAVPVISSLTSLSLKGVSGEAQCSTYSIFRLLSQPANGGTIVLFDNKTGEVTYLTPNTFEVTLDHFTFAISCGDSVSGPWECQGSAFVLLSKGTPAPTVVTSSPQPTLPGGVIEVNDQLFCSGTCDGDDIMKVTSGLKSVFDINNTLGSPAGWSRRDGRRIGEASYAITREGTLRVFLRGKVANMMSGRFPTFSPLTPDQYYTSASVPENLRSAVAFNATCLDEQSRFGIAEELWDWTNISKYEGRTIGNYASSDNIYQKFGGKHIQCDTFILNSCKYAPTLTPATVPNVFVGDYSLRNSHRLTPPNVDWSSYIRWKMTIEGCDTLWETELTPRQVRSLASVGANGVKNKFFQRISDRVFTSNLYSQVVKPNKWHPPFTGVDTIYSPNPIAVSVGNSFEVDSAQVGFDSSVVRSIKLILGEVVTSAPTSTSTFFNTTFLNSTFFNTTAYTTQRVTSGVNATSTPAQNSLNATYLFNSTNASSTNFTTFATSFTSSSTASPKPTTTATTTTTTPAPLPFATFVAPPNVTISSDVQYFSGSNNNLERTYGYNIILYPVSDSSIDFKNLFVADVAVVSADYTAPSKSNCPACVGVNATCFAKKTNRSFFNKSNLLFDSDCVVDNVDTSLVSIVPGPSLTSICGDANRTSVASRFAGLVAGVSGTSCPQTYFNITLRGTVRGARSAVQTGQAEGELALKVVLSNGQVFQTTLSQHVYFSQVSSNVADLIHSSSCRSTAYFPVKDPFGPSSSTNRLTIMPLHETAVSASILQRVAAPTASRLQASAKDANNGDAANASLRMFDDEGDLLCASDDSPILGITDWAFFQIETNDTLDRLILSVPAKEVTPSSSSNELSFVLATGPQTTWSPISSKEYHWKKYAAMLNVRHFETSVNLKTGTLVHSFAFIPGTLLHPKASSLVHFTVEAIMRSRGGSEVYVRTSITVSSQMSPSARKDVDESRDMFDLGTIKSLFTATDEATSASFLILSVIGVAIFACLVGVYFNDSAKSVVLDQHAIVMEFITGRKPKYQEEREKEMMSKNKSTAPPSGKDVDLSVIVGRDLPSVTNNVAVSSKPTNAASRDQLVLQAREEGLVVHEEPQRRNNCEVEDEPVRRHNSEEMQ